MPARRHSRRQENWASDYGSAVGACAFPLRSARRTVELMLQPHRQLQLQAPRSAGTCFGFIIQECRPRPPTATIQRFTAVNGPCENYGASTPSDSCPVGLSQLSLQLCLLSLSRQTRPRKPKRKRLPPERPSVGNISLTISQCAYNATHRETMPAI